MQARKTAEAVEAGLRLLGGLYEQRGHLTREQHATVAQASNDEEVALIFASRFAAAWGQLMCDPELKLTPLERERLLIHHRWIDTLFALSGFRTSDHVVSALTGRSGQAPGGLDADHLPQLLCSYSSNARTELDFELCWRADPALTALALLHYTGSKYCFDAQTHALRERILEWLPERLTKIRLGSLTLLRTYEMYMHCSYASTPRKHELKRALMAQMRSACLAAGCPEAPVGGAGVVPGRRPTMVVIAENLRLNHAVFRTHSEAVRSLRERFHVIGVVFPDPTGTAIAELFDECLTVPPGEFRAEVRAWAQAIVQREPALVLFLGVGMMPQVVGLASLRLAPVQCVSFGHTATTMSPTMDYFVLPQDFVADASTFSERVLALPKEAMPTVPPPMPKVAPRRADGRVQVAIQGSVMKLNPRVFEAVGRIARTTTTPVEFQFFPQGALGLPHLLLTREVKAAISGATVFPEAPHDTYMQRLAQCDLFLCPFPYGNMNSLVDAFLLGLPGVCLDGQESHAHADAAYFARVGLPAELSAQTVEAYVQAAVRLIDDKLWREQCANIVKRADLDAAFFKGQPHLFCQALGSLIAGNSPVITHPA